MAKNTSRPNTPALMRYSGGTGSSSIKTSYKGQNPGGGGKNMGARGSATSKRVQYNYRGTNARG